MKDLCIATFNCGLLRIQFCGVTLFQNPILVSERFSILPETLYNWVSLNNIDVLLLQEVYEIAHVKEIIRVLTPLLPHIFCKLSGFLRFSSGLLTFSRFPIIQSKEILYNKTTLIEYLFASKSFQETTIQLASGQMACFINHHTTSWDGPRLSELVQSFKIVKSNELVFMCGDFNCGPDTGNADFKVLLDEGWIDSFDTLVHTWENTNVLNCNGIHKHCSSGRIDHIMHHKHNNVKVKSVCIHLNEISPVTVSSVSDHYGVLVEYSIS